MTNASNDPRSIAYGFEQINRSDIVFPPAKQLTAPPFLRKWNEAKFEYPGRCQATEGIVLYRLIATQGPWVYADLRGRGRQADAEPLCSSCSTTAQALVFHPVQKCSNPTFMHVIPDYVECSPDMERMQGVQLLKKNRNKKPPNAHVSFPCKYDGPEACVHNGNYPRRCLRSAVSCNKHMQKAHHGWSELANAMYPVTVEDKSATDKPATDKPAKYKPALR